jgi:hypothetical protein
MEAKIILRSKKLEAEGSRISNTQTLHPNRMGKAIKHPEDHATPLGRPKATVPPFLDGVVWIRFRKNMFVRAVYRPYFLVPVPIGTCPGRFRRSGISSDMFRLS